MSAAAQRVQVLHSVPLIETDAGECCAVRSFINRQLHLVRAQVQGGRARIRSQQCVQPHHQYTLRDCVSCSCPASASRKCTESE